MTSNQLITQIQSNYNGLSLLNTFGEKSLFYNPDNLLPKGIYFATIKEGDGQNDKASGLYREGIFRFNFGVTKTTYEELFGTKPARPVKGGIVDTCHDFTALNQLTPHPIYAWLHWVAVLNPQGDTLKQVWELLDESYEQVLQKYAIKIKKLS
jgi:hypothetical protein